ncbi:universal stress protein [Snuella lapsa]|uniref:Universal stress protein n=1 Tax=Snuella lapsa TaxID=870481 RepID=A0ABP6X957_9FLAO
MKNILLPTDFSDNSWNAIKYALNFFENNECNFYLLHVNRLNNIITEEDDYIQTPEVIEAIYTKPAKNKLRNILKRISLECSSNKSYKFYAQTDHDFFIDSIRKHVDENRIDLIVMGTKGASGLPKIIAGSNTGDVITKVRCTTLVVPENATFTRPKEVAFPTDFHLFYHIDTLQPVLDILERYKATLRIVHVSKRHSELNSDQENTKELLKDYFSYYDFSFHFLTNKKIEDAIQCFVESRGVNMVVMVAKNLNYFQQILFHSNVENISYHTDIPFLVLHERH